MRQALSNYLILTTLVALATFVLRPQDAVAENRLNLTKTSVNTISVELSNADAIAGFQFSINGRGGISLGDYKTSDRANAGGLSLYQYLKDDSTLNVLILAPALSSLPAGVGALGSFSFRFVDELNADTVRVFLSGVVLCDVRAQYLEVMTGQLLWKEHQSRGDQAPSFTLEQNFPNPFNPSTTITYRLEKQTSVRLAVYDITGRQVWNLVDQYQSPGRYDIRWNADGPGGSKLSSGIYFARLQVEGQVAVQKMILTK
jgi:hypothetical protein